MERKETNRANQLSIDKEFIKGVKLIDVDTAIADYMADSIIPDVEENGNKLKIPLVYGNAERWEGARKNGYLRDKRGRVQIPLIMFKRNSVERNENNTHFRDQMYFQAYKKYSSKNRYEKFSLDTAIKPMYELYSVQIPSYVTITYEVMVWTNFTEHMNEIIEAYQQASDKYWGNVDKYKFRVRINSFETSQEVAESSERLVRTTFSMEVHAYLLPETFDNKPTVKKELTKKRVVFGVETDLSGNLFANPTVYNEYAQVIDFIAIRGNQMATFVNATTVKLTNVKKPLLPSELIGIFDTDNWFRVYINGDFISPTYYTYTYNGSTKEIIFTFQNLSFSIEVEDEIAITGKFEEL